MADGRSGGCSSPWRRPRYHSHGVANVTTGTTVTPSTVFRIGSLTKTITAVAVLQLGAGPGRPRRPRERVPLYLPVAPDEAASPARNASTPAHAHRRSRLLAPPLRPAPPGLGAGRGGASPSRSVTTTAADCRRRSSPAPSGSTATTASPRSDRWWRTSPGRSLATTCASTSSSHSGWRTRTWSGRNACAGLPPATWCAPAASCPWPTGRCPRLAAGSVLDLGRPGSIRGLPAARGEGPVAGSCKRRPSRSCSPRSSSRTCACPAWAGLQPRGRGRLAHRWQGRCGGRASSPPCRWRRVPESGSRPGQHRRAERPRGPRPRRDGPAAPAPRPEDPIRTDVAPRPDVWAELCGWYSPAPGPVTNLFARALMGAGAEVVVDGRQPVLKPISPVPALRRGMPLHPDDADDPFAFRVDLSALGMGTLPLLFATADGGRRVQRLWLDSWRSTSVPTRATPGALRQRRILVAGAGCSSQPKSRAAAPDRSNCPKEERSSCEPDITGRGTGRNASQFTNVPLCRRRRAR